jgi:3-methyl-2-oxobutanoate hydroxymethyltransferase
VEIVRSALELEKAGVFSIVLEAIPHRLGELITQRLSMPTIGIGAGPSTSGQVLVWDDVMGTWSGHKAKFVRRFADVQSEAKRGVTGYAAAVRGRAFPDTEAESYPMEDVEWQWAVAELK